MVATVCLFPNVVSLKLLSLLNISKLQRDLLFIIFPNQKSQFGLEGKPIRKYYCQKTLLLLVGICITHQLVIHQYAIIPHNRVTMSSSCRALLQSLQNNTGTPKKLKSQRPFKIHPKTFINRFLHVYNDFYPNF